MTMREGEFVVLKPLAYQPLGTRSVIGLVPTDGGTVIVVAAASRFGSLSEHPAAKTNATSARAGLHT